jgi:hypothetical protein
MTFYTIREEETHVCAAPLRERIAELERKQIVIQLPDNPGPVYDDLLIALEAFLKKINQEH